MEYINLILVAVFAVFLVIETKASITRFRAHREALKEVLQNKEDVVLIKDYRWMIVGYIMMAVLMTFYSMIYVQNGEWSFAAIFWLFDGFCLIFVLDAIMTRTMAFFESGFLFESETIKYRSVLKIEEKKQFLKGYPVKLTKDGVVYVTPKARVVLEEKLKAYKERKKKR